MSKLNLYLYISILENFYIIYMFRYFKTKISFHYSNVQNYFINLSNCLRYK